MRYLLLLLALAGCATQGMSADQIAAMVKDKNNVSVCVVGTGMWGAARVVVVDVDQATKAGTASVVVDTDCKTTVSNTVEAKAPPAK